MMNLEKFDGDLWKIEYTAAVNQLYYEELSRRWMSIDSCIVIISAGLGVVSLATGVLGFSSDSSVPALWSTMASALALAVMGFASLIPFSKRVRRYQDLRKKWTELRGRCEQLYVRVSSSKAMAPQADSIDELQKIIAKKTQLDDEESEYPCNRPLLDECQRKINIRTYKVDVGTYHEVMEKLAVGS